MNVRTVDVVIWGNEHECQPRLAESLVGTYRIYQPGTYICSRDFPIQVPCHCLQVLFIVTPSVPCFFDLFYFTLFQ